ncbi:MAG: hypothetical protein HC911_10460 [Chloroflexaceae bacterium]|nr:hypothetical protein [Chloroflexaceae bacterium]
MQRLSQFWHAGSSHTYRTLLIAGAILLTVFALVTQAFAWSGPLPVPGSQSTEVFNPRVAVDDAGFVHVTWMFTPGGNTGDVYYVRGELDAAGTAITWQGVQVIHRSSAREFAAGARVAVGSDGIVHVVFIDGSSNVVYYRNEQRGEPGQWISEAVFSGNSFATSVDLDLDATNIPFIAWSDGVGDGRSNAAFAYRAGPNGWVPAFVGPNTYLARNVSIAVAGTGPAAGVHIVYEYQDSQNTTWKAGYARGNRDGGDFTIVPISGQFGFTRTAWFPDIAYDRSTGILYMTQIFQVGDRFWQGYGIAFSSSPDGGITWAPPARLIATENPHAGDPHIIAAEGIVHFSMELKGLRSNNYVRALQQAHYMTFNAATGAYSTPVKVSQDGEKASIVDIGIGARAKVITWAVEDIRGVKYNVDPGGIQPPVPPTPTPIPATPTPTPPPNPQGRLSILDPTNLNDRMTRSQQVKAQFGIVNAIEGRAYGYDLSNDGSNFSPRDNLPSNNTVDWTMAPAAGVACEARTIRGRLYDGETGLSSEILEASIMYDPGVDVAVTVENPFLQRNLTQIQASGALLQDFGGAGAMAGDPSFTRSPFYFGSVTRNPGECNSIQDVRFGQITPATSINGVPSGLIPIDQFNPQDGDYTVTIEVTDSIGNRRTFNGFTMTLDRTAPQITGVYTSAMQIVNASNSPISTVSTPLVDIRFTDLEITDTGYGEKNSNKPFFGVWLANSTQRFDLTDESQLAAVNNLDWRGVEVANATNNGEGAFTFTVRNWSVFTGLQSMQGGRDQYIYARVIDGAGNASVVTLESQRITLEQGVSPFRQYLPFTVRQ